MMVALGGFVALAVGFPEASAQRPPAGYDRASPSSELIALSSDVEGRQQITVIDPRSRVIAVYHVDRATGALSLKSVRNVSWDLLIEDFNSANPTPREIRALAEPR
jgi:hypothetical protein